jgi:hypothetical protein
VWPDCRAWCLHAAHACHYRSCCSTECLAGISILRTYSPVNLQSYALLGVWVHHDAWRDTVWRDTVWLGTVWRAIIIEVTTECWTPETYSSSTCTLTNCWFASFALLCWSSMRVLILELSLNCRKGAQVISVELLMWCIDGWRFAASYTDSN